MTLALRAQRQPHSLAHALVKPLNAALAHSLVKAFVRKSAFEDSLAALHPMLSLGDVRARIIGIINETPDTKTFVLRTNAFWRGAIPGQFVQLKLEINGRRVERFYSVSSCSDASVSSRAKFRTLSITVKLQNTGGVSEHLHSHVAVGDVVTLGAAAGTFVLPKVMPEKILFLSGGSGITPMLALLEELHMRRFQGSVILLHTCRTPQDFIFANQLKALANKFSALKVLTHYTQASGPLDAGLPEAGPPETWRLDAESLLAMVPDLAQRSTWLCGPGSLMNWVQAHWKTQGLQVPLVSERFAIGPTHSRIASIGEPVTVALSASEKRFVTSGSDVLLVQAERAGFTPKFGCRLGICATCQCVKQSGTVENIQTGEVSSAPGELIRLCVSVARTDLELQL